MLRNIRNKYPQYSDLSDQDLADKFHNKFYSDMPKNTFYQKIGFSQQQPSSLGTAIAKYAPSLAGGIGKAGDIAKSITQSAPGQAVLGAGDEVRQKLQNIFEPSAGFTPSGDPSRFAYKAGGVGGDIGSYGAMLSALPESAIARMVGSGVFGGLTSKDKLKGGAEGLAAGAAGEALPAVAKAFSPKKLTNNIMGFLSKGKSFEGNTKSLAEDIKNKYEENKTNASKLYGSFFDKYGKNKVEGDYLNIPGQDVKKNMLPMTNKVDDVYRKNPTLENAHKLQSQLGSDIRKVSTASKMSIGDLMTSESYKYLRDSLKNDIDNSLSGGAQALPKGVLSLPSKGARGIENPVDKYKEISNYYLNKVTPYKSNKSLFDISRGIEKNPKNISSIFKFPNDNINSIVNDLGEDGKEKILHSHLGKTINITPEKLLSKVGALDKDGFSSYMTDALNKNLSKLGFRIGAKKAALKAGTFLGAASLVPHAAGVLPEVAAGLLAAGVDPLEKIGVPNIGKLYPALRTALIGAGLGVNNNGRK